jgi:hypothetical protein
MLKELKIPTSLSLCVAFIFWLLIKHNKVNVDNLEKLTDVSINIAGVLLGFLITLHGILISIRGSKIMRMLQQANKLDELNSKMKAAIGGSALLLIYCLVILIFDFSRLLGFNTKGWEFIVWIYFILVMAISSYRFISLFITIISEDSE